MSVQVRIDDRDPKKDLDPLGKERDWTKNEVILRRIQPDRGDETAKASQTGEASLTADAKKRFQYLATTRSGPHTPPVEWTSFIMTDRVLKDGDPALPVGLGVRKRLSAWTSGPKLWALLDHPEVVPLTSDKKQALAGTDAKVLNAFAGIDDVTLTQTIINAEKDPDTVDWADNFLKSSGKAGKEGTFVSSMIPFFHKRKVQLFVGFFIDTGVGIEDLRYGKRFLDWLRGKKVPSEPDDLSQNPFRQHARNLVAFFEDKKLDFDGLSYDLEIGGKPAKDAKDFATKKEKEEWDNAPSPNLDPSDAPLLKLLFQAVAAELRKKGRYLAYATSGFTSAPTKEVYRHMATQPFSLARDIPDVLARAMSYLGDRAKIIQYALGTEKLHPGQLQIGMATVKVPNPTVKNGKIVTEWVTPKRDLMLSEADALDRKYRTGLIHWYLETAADVASYREINAKLNDGEVERGTGGQPLQGPINAQRAQAFIDAGATDVYINWKQLNI